MKLYLRNVIVPLLTLTILSASFAYADSYDEVRSLAEQGDVYGYLRLGLMYYTGEGVPQDYANAIDWYRKTAKNGEAHAKTKLDQLYEAGLRVPQN